MERFNGMRTEAFNIVTQIGQLLMVGGQASMEEVATQAERLHKVHYRVTRSLSRLGNDLAKLGLSQRDHVYWMHLPEIQASEVFGASHTLRYLLHGATEVKFLQKSMEKIRKRLERLEEPKEIHEKESKWGPSMHG
jgi:hypothetical protein